LSKGVPVLFDSMKARWIQPRLRPFSEAALVITRPWYCAESATFEPPSPLKTITLPCFSRNARSSAKVGAAEEGLIASPFVLASANLIPASAIATCGGSGARFGGSAGGEGAHERTTNPNPATTARMVARIRRRRAIRHRLNVMRPCAFAIDSTAGMFSRTVRYSVR
jgi:hypothetical protein